MCTGLRNSLEKDDSGKYGLMNKKTGEIAYLGESREQHYKRVGKMRQKEADELASQRNAVMAQQQAESQRLQAQMVAQQKAQNAKVAGLRAEQKAANQVREAEQAKKVSGIRSRGQSVVSSLAILGQNQQTAPTASQTARPTRKGSGTTKAAVVRGSAQGGGINLSI